MKICHPFAVSTMRKIFDFFKDRPHLNVLIAFALIVGAGLALSGAVKKEKVAFSQFELRADVADAAGIHPSTTFTLKSAADIDESAVERYLSLDPDVKIEVKKVLGGFEIKPKEKLPENAIVTFKIDESPISEKTYSWAYQVKAPFQVISTLPRDKGSGVSVPTGIEITFNREKLIHPQDYVEFFPQIQGKFEQHRNVLVFIPNRPLDPQKVYTVTVKKGLKSEGSEDALSENHVFQFETEAESPSYSMAQFGFDKTFWEFPLANEPAFAVYASNVPNASQLSVNVARFDTVNQFVESYKSSLRFQTNWSRFNRFVPYEAPDEKKIFESNVSMENQLDVKFIRIPQKFDEGYYVLTITVDKKPHQAWFQVTNFSNYVAVSGSQSLIWLRSLDGGQREADAHVSFEGREIGKTNADGVAQFETPADLVSARDDAYSYWKEPAFFYIVKAQGKELAIPIESRYGGFYKINSPDQWWDYLSLDKTVYQPDDTLRFWGVMKQRNGSDVKGEEITMQLSTPFWYGTSRDDVTVYAQTKAKVSDFYTLTGEMNFSGLKPGLYQLSMKRGDEIIVSENVSVETYVAPAYRLTLTPDKNAIFAGDSVNMKVRGEFFDGTPVSNGQMKYAGYLNGPLSSRVQLDENGEGNFTVKTDYIASAYWPKYLRITVSPVLAEEGEIAQSVSVLVFGPNMDLQADQQVGSNSSKFNLKLREVTLEKIQAGQPFWVQNNYLGAAVANNAVNVEVKEVIFKKTQIGTRYDIINKATYPIYDYSTEEHTVRQMSVTTDDKGETSFEQKLEEDKTYKIIFTTRDTNGRAVEVQRYAFGYSRSPFSGYDTSGVALKNRDEEKKQYKLGEKISLELQDNAGNAVASSPRDFLFIRVVGGVHSYELADEPNYTDTFQDMYIPNVNVIGVWFSGKRFHDSWPMNLSFEAEEKRLQINVSKDKERYKPGEEVRLNIEVTDPNGNPKEAQVHIGALDEAVFTLNPTEKDITSALYNDVYVSLLTRSSHLTPLESGAELGGCFLSGTQILTPLGSKSIEDVHAGETILTKESEDSSALVEAKVARVTSHLVRGYVIVNDKLRVTENHRLYINGEWNKAGQLKIGDMLQNSMGKQVAVTSIQKVDEWVNVHNFEVEGNHTYFADTLYVHNEEKGGGEARGEFEDVAIYKSILTDSDGRANVSFALPDNITSWRVTLQAVSKDWLAGKTIEFVPVGLPLFVEASLNRTYLDGDKLIIRTRVFGTEEIQYPVTYRVESDTLPFKLLEKSGSRSEEFNLGQLSVGTHQIKVSANAGGFSDAIVKEIRVLDSYFTQSAAEYHQVSSSLEGIKGNEKGFTQLIFTSQERAIYYWPLLALAQSGGVRVDQVSSRYFGGLLLKKFFGEEQEDESPEFRAYQPGSGGIALLPYSDEDLRVSAQFADLMKEENIDISREMLKTYFTQSLNDRKADASRVVLALYGLAALKEPVLVSLQHIKDEKDLTLMDKAYIALALDTIGAKEEARAYYQEHLKQKLVSKSPYFFVEELKSADENIILTALLAQLAGSLQEPEAEGLASYVFEQQPKEKLINFELLGYLKAVLPRLKGEDVSFAYRTKDRADSHTLKAGESVRLAMAPEELQTLRFENVSGRVDVVSRYDQAVDPEELAMDESLRVTRRYVVNGMPTTEFKEGDIVKIELSDSFGLGALKGRYQVIDHLPSGLRAVTRLNVIQSKEGDCVRYPARIEDQTVTFLDWNPKFGSCSALSYYARVVTKGEYEAEPVLIQSAKSSQSLNVSAPDRISIRE